MYALVSLQLLDHWLVSQNPLYEKLFGFMINFPIQSDKLMVPECNILDNARISRNLWTDNT